MSEKNADNFTDLSPDKQQELIAYIANNFKHIKTFKRDNTAYRLKQHYTRLHVDKKLHITSKCFMEAMLETGFQAKPVRGTSVPNWYFNVSIPKSID